MGFSNQLTQNVETYLRRKVKSQASLGHRIGHYIKP